MAELSNIKAMTHEQHSEKHRFIGSNKTSECSHIWDGITCKNCRVDIFDLYYDLRDKQKQAEWYEGAYFTQRAAKLELRVKLEQAERDITRYKNVINRQYLRGIDVIGKMEKAKKECDEALRQVDVLRSALELAGVRLYELAEFNQMPVPREDYVKIVEETYGVISVVQNALQVNVCGTCQQECKFDTADPSKCNAYVPEATSAIELGKMAELGRLALTTRAMVCSNNDFIRRGEATCEEHCVNFNYCRLRAELKRRGNHENYIRNKP